MHILQSLRLTLSVTVSATLFGCILEENTHSQSTGGTSEEHSIAGTVLSTQGIPLGNSSVHLLTASGGDTSLSMQPKATSNAEGFFHFDSLPEGLYLVRVSLMGFDSNSTSVQIHKGKQANIIITLSPVEEAGACFTNDQCSLGWVCNTWDFCLSTESPIDSASQNPNHAICVGRCENVVSSPN